MYMYMYLYIYIYIYIYVHAGMYVCMKVEVIDMVSELKASRFRGGLYAEAAKRPI